MPERNQENTPAITPEDALGQIVAVLKGGFDGSDKWS